MKGRKRFAVFSLSMLLFCTAVLGCKAGETEEKNADITSDNVIITETGEVLVKPQPTEEPEKTAESASETPKAMGNEELGELPPPNVIPEVSIEEPKQEQVISEEDQIAPKGGNLQIVFLGDSIFDTYRDGTGIPFLTAEQCDADIYNLAIGGTSASIGIDEQYESENWTSRSLVGVVKAICGDIPTDVFAGTRAKEIIDSGEVDFKATDYFVIEYGLNDFFNAAPLSNEDNEFDYRTYVGALRYAVATLGSYADDATIILCGPNYAQFFDGDAFIGDGNTLNTGYGTLFDYKGICQYVANESNSYFFDAYLDLGINGYTAEEYLEDGVHLSEKGRHLYADALAKLILRIEENKNN